MSRKFDPSKIVVARPINAPSGTIPPALSREEYSQFSRFIQNQIPHSESRNVWEAMPKREILEMGADGHVAKYALQVVENLQNLVEFCRALADVLIFVGGLAAGIEVVKRVLDRIRRAIRTKGRKPTPCLDAIAYHLVAAAEDGLAVDQLVERTSYARNTIRRNLKILVDSGAVTKYRLSGDGPTYYRLNVSMRYGFGINGHDAPGLPFQDALRKLMDRSVRER